MNIKQSIPRIDCVRFAKCGKKSLAHCRKYRGTDEECAGCKLIKCRSSTKYVTSKRGNVLKKCSCCGRSLKLNWFYRRIVKRNDKIYQTHSSACRMCINKPKLNK